MLKCVLLAKETSLVYNVLCVLNIYTNNKAARPTPVFARIHNFHPIISIPKFLKKIHLGSNELILLDKKIYSAKSLRDPNPHSRITYHEK